MFIIRTAALATEVFWLKMATTPVVKEDTLLRERRLL